MKGGFGDEYYMRLIAGIRRFRGLRGQLATGSAAAVSIDAGSLEQWNNAAVTAVPRFPRRYNTRQRRLWRNPLSRTTPAATTLSVCQGRAGQRKPLFLRRDRRDHRATDRWMSLLLNTGAERAGQVYHYIINRMRAERQQGCGGEIRRQLELGAGGVKRTCAWRTTGSCWFCRRHCSVFRAASGTPIAFKWADNYQPDDIYLVLYRRRCRLSAASIIC